MLWAVNITNDDPKHPVRVVRCTPFDSDKWEIAQYYDVRSTLNNDYVMIGENEFFYVLRKGDDGAYHLMDSSEGHSDEALGSNADGVNITWNLPNLPKGASQSDWVVKVVLFPHA